MGRGPAWPFFASVVLFFVEGLQIGFGYARELGLHVPLGVAIITAVIALFVWSLRWRPRAPRTRWRTRRRGTGRAEETR